MVVPSLGGGGAERATILLADGLAAHGNDVVLVVEKNLCREIYTPGDQVRVERLGVSSTRSTLVPLMRHLRREKPRVAYSALPHLNLTLALALKMTMQRSTKFVPSVHNNLGAEFTELRGASLYRRTLPWVYRRADAIHAVSDGVAQSIRATCPNASGKVRVVHNPVSLNNTPPGQRDPHRIVSVGRLEHQKNFPLLIEAFARVAAQLPLVTLTILGEGSERPRLEKLIAERGLADRVELPGQVANVAEHLLSSAVYVQTSRFEGFGIALVEAMFAGALVVSTDVDYGPREVLEGGQLGTLCPQDAESIAKAIIELLTDGDSDLVSRAKSAAEKYRPDRIAAFFAEELGFCRANS